MPFQSEAQRRFMYAKHPDIAKKWSAEYGPQHNLPEHKSDNPASGAMDSLKRFFSGEYGAEQERKRLKPPASGGSRG